MALVILKGNPFMLNDVDGVYIEMYKRLEAIHNGAKAVDNWFLMRFEETQAVLVFKNKKSTLKYNHLTFDEFVKKIEKKLSEEDKPKLPACVRVTLWRSRFKVAMDIMKNGGTCTEEDDALIVTGANQTVRFCDISLNVKTMGAFFTDNLNAIKTCAPKVKVSKTTKKNALSLEEQNKRMMELLRNKGIQI